MRDSAALLFPRDLMRFMTRLIAMITFFLNATASMVQGQQPPALRVHLEAGEGPYYVGEGIELAVAVPGRDQRPRLELPSLNQADIWTAGTSFRPLSASGIGNMVSGRNLYLTRLRMIPRRAGPLLVPPVTARLDDQSGKSKPLRLEIEPVPLLGRPAEFLGGIGAFSAGSQRDARPRFAWARSWSIESRSKGRRHGAR